MNARAQYTIPSWSGPSKRRLFRVTPGPRDNGPESKALGLQSEIINIFFTFTPAREGGRETASEKENRGTILGLCCAVSVAAGAKGAISSAGHV